MALVFGSTVFISSVLLFWVQPMVSKMILPLFGGTPSVWTSCMLFFQIFLLAGYLYAHLISVKISSGKQIFVHCFLLLAGVVFLPFAFSDKMVADFSWNSNPVFLLIGLLVMVVGFPFFIVSASSPLIQKWFSKTSDVSATDPYFLYAASNAGSLIAILAYPLLIEPVFPLTIQSKIWALSYRFLVVFFVLIGVITWFSGKKAGMIKPVPAAEVNSQTAEQLSIKRILSWILLAFVPSSLMLGITTHITTDIASVPLLWVVPLALYLLSFILVFARKSLIPQGVIEKLFPVFTVVIVFMILTEIEKPVWLVFLFFLLFLFITAMACHGQLSTDRPSPRHLTEYYVFISVGGALGGVFNAIISPIIFTHIVELPLVLVIASIIYKRKRKEGKSKKNTLLDIGYPIMVGGLTIGLALIVPRITLEPYQLWMFVIFGIPLFVSYFFIHRPLRFGLALGAIFMGSLFYPDIYGNVVYANRNFFGYIHVNYDKTGPYHRLFYGTTQHGLQFVLPERKGEALAYYHRTGPFGDIYQAYRSNPASHSIAVIGLGIGAMLSYSAPGQHWTFYEIDPEVVRIAKDSRFFTHWQDG
ncbi:MAG: hypothetical protein KAT17_06360, partial [Candidatus Aminicenantes bacterium]|nr:hypothetical protein [Candidatus Aminicenantes bacterium]